MNYATLDLETNGFKGTSVLSASSIVFDEKGTIVDFFNRFYFPCEELDLRALRIHGLNMNRINWLRSFEKYPESFMEDTGSLVEFWDINNAEKIIVHNLSFDTSFLPASARKRRKWWCSMKGLTDLCSIPGSRGRYKWPRLEEAERIIKARFFPPDPTNQAEISMPRKIPHSSLSDCFNLYSVFMRVFANEPEWISFLPVKTVFQAPPTRPQGINPSRNDLTPDFFAIELVTYALHLSKICTRKVCSENMVKIFEEIGNFNTR